MPSTALNGSVVTSDDSSMVVVAEEDRQACARQRARGREATRPSDGGIVPKRKDSRGSRPVGEDASNQRTPRACLGAEPVHVFAGQPRSFHPSDLERESLTREIAKLESTLGRATFGTSLIVKDGLL